MNTGTPGDAAGVWVVDDDRAVRFVLATALSDAGYDVSGFDSAQAALSALRARGAPRLLFTDVRMPGDDGLALLEKLKQACPQLPVVVMSAYTDVASTAGAFRGGAHEFLSKPFDLDEAVALAARVLGERVEAAPAAAEPEPAGDALVGDTPAMRQLFRAIGRLAQAPLTVLITGETGTGKELVARALHRESPRARKPFVALNTAAIPAELLESELFGHEAGAFTGAARRHTGRFEQADGGTLFLDEIGDMPAPLQTRLLRVLAEGEFFRVGGRELIRVDVRVIAATHQDLEALAREGRFRAAQALRQGGAGAPARPRLARQRARAGEPVLAAGRAGAGGHDHAGRPRRHAAIDWRRHERRLGRRAARMGARPPGRGRGRPARAGARALRPRTAGSRARTHRRPPHRGRDPPRPRPQHGHAQARREPQAALSGGGARRSK